MPASRTTIPLEESQRPYFAGIDLGGTNIKLGLVDDSGRTLAYRSIRTEVDKGPEDGARRMGEAVSAIAEQAGLKAADVARVGLVTPGTMDIPKGMLLRPHNLPGWFDFPIRDRVSQHAKAEVTYSNDANAAAYGEFWCGRAASHRSMIFLTLGTGVGGGIILGDLAIVGEHSAGAECGHIVIDSSDSARICPCGRAGHLEAYASATAVIARTIEALDSGRSSSLAEARGAGEKVTPLLIARHAENGDALADQMVMETARWLGIGVATLLHVIDPDGVVLGGAMTFGGCESELGRRFLGRVEQEACRRCLDPIADNLRIEFATLGSDAGYIGAAGLARLDYQKTLHG